MAKSQFTIKHYKSARRPRLKFVVRSKVTGKWSRKFFETKAEAKTHVEQQEIELENHGREGAKVPPWLRALAARAHDLLEPFGKNVLEAAEFYVKHLDRMKRSAPVEQAVAELIQNRRSNNVSARYVKDLQLRLGRFSRSFAARNVAEIDTAEIDDWLSALNLAPNTRNTFRRDIRTLFSFCATRGYCQTNPAAHASRAKTSDAEVEILTLPQLARLLESACEKTLPFVAIGAFAGLRPAELERLAWEEIDFEAGLIEIKAKKAKSARRRLVTMQPNLMQWLLPYRGSAGLLRPSNLRKLLDATRERAGLSQWPSNALRHSFASYHLAHFRDAAALALEMGHMSQQMIYDHYRKLVTPEQAAKYWQLSPASPAVEKAVVMA